MSLPDINLDTLEWQDMVGAVRDQIAAASAEEWTLHAAVDPGVTLLELFAYALEQRVYWLDQVTDPVILAMLALLGEQPRPARAARMLVELMPDTDAVVDVMAAADLQRNDDDTAIHFRTLDSMSVLPIERVEIASQFGSRVYSRKGPSRWHATPLTLLPSDSSPGEFRCDLWIRGAPHAANEALKLFLEIDAPSAISPQWTHDAVDPVEPPASVNWMYSSGGGRAAFPDASLKDETQSLRRAGMLSLEIPGDWDAVGPPENGLSRYSLWCVVDESTFSAPPQILRAIPNVVVAAHECARELAAHDVDAQVDNWLPLPGMQLQLSDPLPPLEDNIALRIRERDGNWYDWLPTADLGRHGPGDRVYTVDRLRRQFEFGDGLTARVPIPDSSAGTPLAVSYLGGGGEGGNVGSNLVWQVAAHADLLGENPVPASGGEETETPHDARTRVAVDLERRERAITASDFEELSLGTPGIALARAHAAVGLHPRFPCNYVPGAVTVYIVPDVPRGPATKAERRVDYPQPDPGAVSEVLRRLDERRLITTEVFVRGPTYRRVSVHVVMSGDEVAGQDLRTKIADGLKLYFDPLTGGESGDGWPFGHPVRLSEIAHVIDGIAHRVASVSELSVALDDDEAQSDCKDLEIGANDLVCFEKLSLEWRAAPRRRGGLR